MTTPRSELVRTTARVLAVALAIGILGWLVIRAQREAHAIDLPVTTEPAGEILTLPAGLSSSKSVVLEQAVEQSPAPAPRRARRTVIRPMQDSKAGIIAPAPAEPTDPTLLFGSKSGPVPAVKSTPAPAAPKRNAQ